MSKKRAFAIFADCSRALCRCTLLFCSLSQFPLGKQSFQYMSGETRTYTLSHQGRTVQLLIIHNILGNISWHYNVTKSHVSRPKKQKSHLPLWQAGPKVSLELRESPLSNWTTFSPYTKRTTRFCLPILFPVPDGHRRRWSF